MKKKPVNHYRSKLILEEMEQRQLFSGGAEGIIPPEPVAAEATAVNVDANLEITATQAPSNPVGQAQVESNVSNETTAEQASPTTTVETDSLPQNLLTSGSTPEEAPQAPPDSSGFDSNAAPGNEAELTANDQNDTTSAIGEANLDQNQTAVTSIEFEETPLVDNLQKTDQLSQPVAQENISPSLEAMADANIESNTDSEQAQTTNELVIVDTNVKNYQQLIDDITQGNNATRHIDVVLLDSNKDGIAQITETLSRYQNLDAVHLISHGSDGSLDFGSSQLNIQTLVENQAKISAWGNAFSANGDILIYGCNVAETQFGQGFVDYLSNLTKTDVAASENATGQALLGGNWALEYQTGAIEAEGAVSLAMQDQWADVLAVTSNGTVTSTHSTNTTSLTWAHTVNSGTNRALFVQIAIDGLGANVNSVKYGTTDLIRVGRTAGNHAVEIWVLVNPTVGTNNVVVTFSGNTAASAGASTFNGVNQSTPTGTYASASSQSSGPSTTASVNVSSAVGDVVIDAQYWQGAPTGGVAGGGQTIQWWQQNASLTGGSTVEAGAPTVTMSGSFSSAVQWEIGAVSVKAAPPSTPPANSVPSAQTTNENTAKVFSSTNGNQISITDADAGAGNNEITLSITNGTLTLAGTTGLTFTSGDGTTDSTMTFRGTASAINTALNGLSYTPAANYIGASTLTLRTLDSTLVSLNFDANLQARYTFEGNANDVASGTAQNGTLMGNASYANDPVRGQVLTLDGADDYVSLNAHTATFATYSQGTFATWIKTTATGEGTIFDIGDGAFGQNFVSFYILDGQLSLSLVDGNISILETHSTATVNDGNWHHVAVTVSSSGNQLYIDGVAASRTFVYGSAATNSFISSLNAKIATHIGAYDNGAINGEFLGQMDDFRIYDRALGASEIATLAADLTLQDTDTVAITVATVNAVPVNTVPGPQTTNEDTAKVFSSTNGNQISITDADAGAGSNEITLSVTNGTLTLAGTSGLTFTSGDGTADTTMTFRGTAANINTALNGLSYSPTANYNGSATLTLSTLDSTLVALNIDANLQARYTFEGNANDVAAGTAQNGTSVGNATYTTDGTRGQVLTLDGSGDSVQITSTFGQPQNVTIGGWVNLSSGTGRKEFISIDDRVHIALDDAGGVKGSVQVGAGVWTDLNSNQFIAGTGWHHVMYVFNGASDVHTLYIDGAAVASAANTNTIYYTGATTTYIGQHPSNTAWNLNGLVDDVRIYDKALSGSEVASLAADLSLIDTDTVAITVTAINDAPVLDNTGNPTLTTITEDQTTNGGQTVASIIASAGGDRITDVDSGALEGIAIVARSYSGNTWEYSLDNGANWINMFTVSDTSALLLRSTDLVRMIPDGINGGTGSIRFHAWDQTSGTAGTMVDILTNGGSTAFSTANETAYITVTAVNDAPTATNLSTAETYTEDTALNLTDIVISDVDSATVTATLTLSNAAAGSLNTATSGAVTSTYNAGTGVWTASGAVANVNALLAGLTFTPAAHFNSSFTMATSVSDGTTTLTGTKVMTGVAVNDAPTFSSGTGSVTTAIGTDDRAWGVTTQPDGKIVVSGYSGSGFAVARYNSDGSLDTSFSSDGKQTTAIGTSATGWNLTVQTDGKILVAGYMYNGSNFDVALVRYNADGSLDTTFDIDGIVTTPVASGNDIGRSVLVQPDGKILVAGQATNANGDFLLLRYNANGSLDSTFGTSGKVTTDIGTTIADEAVSLALQSDGKIVLAGVAYMGASGNDFAVVRYNSDGSLDTSFGGTGKVTTAIGSGADVGQSVAIQSDGKIVVAGYSHNGTNNDFAVVRYNTNGTLDTSFSGDGKVTVALGSGNDVAYSMQLQTDGKIVLAGYSHNGTNNDFAVARFNTDGSLDTSFSGDGLLVQELGTSADLGQSLTIQGDGKIVVAGYSNVGGSSNFTVMRLNSDGTLDTQFNFTNTLNGSPTYTEGGTAVVLDSNVQIFDTELSAANNFNGATLTLARNGGANSQDALAFDGINVTVSGPNVYVGGVQVGTYTFTGGQMVVTFGANATQALVNTLMQNIVYWNTSDSPPASVQIGWTFSDANSGGQGTGGALTATGSTTVTITAVNDAPTGGNGTISVTEDTTYTFSLSDFGFSDTDGNAMSKVWFDTLPSQGTLQWNGSAFSAGNFVTASDISLGLLTYVPAANASGTGVASFTFRVQDDGGTANGGSDTDATANTITINITAVNDAPTATNLSAAETYTEDTALNLTDIVISDVDSASVTATLTLSNTAAGSLNTGTSGAVTSTYNAGTGVWTASGAVADVNTLLAGLTFTPTANFNSSFTIATSVSDGVAAAITGTKTITGTPINDVPQIIANTSFITNVNAPYYPNIAINDVDASNLEVTLAVTQGGLTFNLANLTGITFLDGDGLYDTYVRFTGTVTNVNTALGNLYYQSGDAAGTSDTLSILVSDLGGTGNGGPKTASASIAITVNAIPSDSSDAFLQGNYLEVGFNSSGSLGSTGGAPVGFNNAGGQLGVESDPQMDGWSTYDGDFIMPGSPVENWGVQVVGTSYDNSRDASAITGGFTDYQMLADSQLATWTGTQSGLQIQQTYTVGANDLYMDVTVQLTNSTGSAMSDVYYYRNADPDNNYNQGSSDTWYTTNTIVSQGDTGGVSLVTASQADGSMLALMGFGTNSRVTYGGFNNTNPLDIYNGTNGLSQSGSLYDDVSVSLAYYYDTIGSGETVTLNFRYYYAEEGLYSPVAKGDTSVVNEGSSININLTANDVPSNYSALDLSSIQIVSGPTNGSVIVNADGTVTYSHDGSETTTDSFSYTISGINGKSSNIATVTLSVSPINDAPTASATSLSATEDTPYSGNLPAASDLDGDSVSYSLGTQASHGTAVVNADGSFSYTPAANYNGADSFTYTIDDGNGGSNTYTVTVSVAAVNDAPTAPATSLSATEDTPYSGNLPAASDLDGDSVSYSLGTQASHGTAVVNADGSFSYTPAANYNGADSFTYTIDDGNGGSNTYTVTVSVAAVNDAPTASATSLSATEDTPYSGNLPAASDLDGDSVSYSLGTQASHGTAVVNADGSFSYTPAANYNGADSFTYTINDGNGGSNTYTVTVSVAAVNDAPTASATSISATEDTPTSGNLPAASDLDGDSVSYSLGTQASHGTAVVNADGSFSYTPAANYNGADSFTYTINDGNGGSNTYTVTVSVAAVNDAPTASATSISATEDTPTSGNLPAASDLDGDSVSYSLGTQASHGTAVVNADGSFSYTPAANYNGADSFTYTINDGNGGSNTYTVTVSVAAVNDAPTASATSLSATEDTPTSGNLPAASDLDGDSVSYSLGTQASHGTAVVNADGSFSYTPAANYNGADSFTYTIDDGNGGSNTYTVTVSVAAVNDAPTAIPVTLSASNEDSPRLITQAQLLATATDVDGDTLMAAGLTISAGLGSLVDNGDGTWTYTPALNDTTQVSFSFTVTDGTASIAASANLDLLPVNDAPVISNTTEISLPLTTTLMPSSGISVASILSSSIWSDADTDAMQGIAITSVTGNGIWQFSTDGISWQSIGKVNTYNALLLVSTSQVRFIPNTAINETATFEFKAWDQTDGNASTNALPAYANTIMSGNNAYSTNTNTVSLLVKSVETEKPFAIATILINDEIQVVTGYTDSFFHPEKTKDTVTDVAIKTAYPTVQSEIITDLRSYVDILLDELDQPEPIRIDTQKPFEPNQPVNTYKYRHNISHNHSTKQLIVIDKNAGDVTEKTFEERMNQISQQFNRPDSTSGPHKIEVQVMLGTAISLTAGFVSWILRGGALLTSFLSTVPLFRRFDPVPILGKSKKSDDKDSDNQDDIKDDLIDDNASVAKRPEDANSDKLDSPR